MTFLLLVFSLIHLNAAAPKEQKQKAPKVIDLGELEVEGEVKRPQVNYVDSQRKIKESIPEFHREGFTELENKLLKPDLEGHSK
jgi:hypothetical protein